MDDAGYGSVRTNQDTLPEQISARSIKKCAFDSGLKSRRAEARRRCGLVDLTNYFGVELDNAGYGCDRSHLDTLCIQFSDESIKNCAFERLAKLTAAAVRRGRPLMRFDEALEGRGVVDDGWVLCPTM